MHVSCGPGVGSAHDRAGVGSLSHLLKGLPGEAAVSQGPPKGAGQKTLAERGRVHSQTPSISGGQRAVSDRVREITGENPQNGVCLQNPGRSPGKREILQACRVRAPDCGHASSVRPSLPPDLSSFHPTVTLRESETGGK